MGSLLQFIPRSVVLEKSDLLHVVETGKPRVAVVIIVGRWLTAILVNHLTTCAPYRKLSIAIVSENNDNSKIRQWTRYYSSHVIVK